MQGAIDLDSLDRSLAILLEAYFQSTCTHLMNGVFMRKLLIMITFLLSSAVTADSPIVRVGSGITSGGEGNSIDFLLSLQADAAVGVGYEDRDFILILTLSSDGAISSDMSYVDININALGYRYAEEFFSGHSAFVDATALNFHYHRNLNLGLDNMYRLSLIGIRTGGELSFNDDNLVAFAELGFDLGAVALGAASEDARMSRDSGITSGFGAHLQAGLELFRQLRIEIGTSVDTHYGGGETRATGRIVCRDYRHFYPDHHFYYAPLHCYDEAVVDYNERAILNRSFLSITYALTENLRLATDTIFSVYRYDNVTDDRSDRDSEWRFLLRLIYQF